MKMMDSPSTSGLAPNPPLASEPRHILVVLNLARRKALYQLISDITVHMRERLELPDNPFKQQHAEPLFAERPSSSSTMATDMTGTTVAPIPVSPALMQLRLAARDDMERWSQDLLSKLRKLLSANEDNTILEARRKRQERIVQAAHPTALDLLGDDPFPAASDKESAIIRAKNLYRPLSTRLSSITPRDKEEVISALLLQCLADGNYMAHDRVMLCHVVSSLGVPLAALSREEAAVAETLIRSQAQMEADQASQAKRKEEGKPSRYWKVGLASVAGAAVIGITGGLAAPVVAGALGGIMGGIGLGGVASFLGVFWMNGALVGTLFGIYGAKLGGEAMDAYSKEVEDFAFIPVRADGQSNAMDNQQPPTEKPKPRLRLTVGTNGLITKPEEAVTPWEPIPPDTEVHALRYEQTALLELGKTLNSIIKTVAWKMVRGEVLKRTVLATLSAALWPPYMIGAVASNLDNPFSRAKNRSDKAGRVLADALEARVQGRRPVTLIGFSLGARVVANCLKQLAEKRVFGVIEDVILIGAPVPSNSAYWAMMKTVASGRVINVFSSQDLVLAFLYRASSAQFGIAGIQSIENVPGVENIDLSEEVDGHLRYLTAMGKILTRCGFEGIAGGQGRIEGGEAVIVGGEGNLLDLDGGWDDDAKPWDGDSLGWQEKEMTQAMKEFEGLTLKENKSTKGKSSDANTAIMDDFDPWAGPESLSSKPMLPLRPEIAKPSVSAPVVKKAAVSSVSIRNPPSLDRDFLTPVLETSASRQMDKQPQPRELTRMEPETPSIPPKAATYPVAGGDYGDSDEEFGGIQMEDNDDGDIQFAEPVPIEDDRFQGLR